MTPENFDSLVAQATKRGNGFVYASVILRRKAPPLIFIDTRCEVRTRRER